MPDHMHLCSLIVSIIIVRLISISILSLVMPIAAARLWDMASWCRSRDVDTLHASTSAGVADVFLVLELRRMYPVTEPVPTFWSDGTQIIDTSMVFTDALVAVSFTIAP